MSWIEQVEVSEADGKLAEMYDALIEQRGKVSNILKVHSLNAEAMGNHLDLYMTLMFGKSGLSRLEREAIAVVVSANNDCAYCVNHHAEALRHYLKDEDTLNLLARAARNVVSCAASILNKSFEQVATDESAGAGQEQLLAAHFTT